MGPTTLHDVDLSWIVAIRLIDDACCLARVAIMLFYVLNMMNSWAAFDFVLYYMFW